MDLSSLSRPELNALRKQIEQEIEARQKVNHRTARQELKDIAAKYGVSLANLMSGMATDIGPAGSGVVYRHPSDPAKGWSGRGRKPNWVKEWEAGGRSLADLRRH